MTDDSGAPEPDSLVDDETRREQEREASAKADPGRGPTPEEEAAADRTKDAAEGVEEPYKEMLDLGANVKGEGEIG